MYIVSWIQFSRFYTTAIFLPNFLNEIIHLPFLKLFIIIFRDVKIRTWSSPANNLELYRAWSDSECMDVQAGLALYTSVKD